MGGAGKGTGFNFLKNSTIRTKTVAFCLSFHKLLARIVEYWLKIKHTVLPAERCDLVGMRLEKVQERFRFCGKVVVFYMWYTETYTTKVSVINTEFKFI